MQTSAQQVFPVPMALRVLAFAIDAVLTVLALVALRPWLGKVPVTVWKETLSFGCLAWLLLRFLLFGKTPGTWVLCLRRTGRRSAPARRGQVGSYTPSRAGLMLRLSATSVALVAALWAASMLRPSIGGSDAEQLASVLVLNDAQLRHTLGEPVRVDIRGVARRGEQAEAGTATFALRLRGQHSRQDMRVHARRVHGAWTIEELSDIEVAPASVTAEVAER